jgi:hypothetical protein
MSTLKKAEKNREHVINQSLKVREANVVKDGLPESDLISINNIGDGT